jgi:chromatin assembly factor 1 subunit A
MMSNFFSKVPLPQATKNKDSAVAPHNSDFEKTFKPFVVRKNVEMAAVNWFTTPTHPPQKNREVIVIDGDDDVEVSLSRKVVGAVHSPPPAKTSSLALVRSTVERLKQGIAPSAPRHRRPGSILGRSIRDIYTELTEAEISGDVAETRSLTRLLEDRTSFPAKVFTFADDVRPGYMGTWSQTSSVIRPRNPFARDILVCDYNYDSDEEWEGEEEGEGEIVGEEDGARGEEADSEEEEDDELDDWLVDDDEEEALDSVSDANGPDPFLIPEPSKKRKAEGHRKDVKKRKVVPLVAFAKGPVLESSINHCSYAPFKAYQLQLFNGQYFLG